MTQSLQTPAPGAEADLTLAAAAADAAAAVLPSAVPLAAVGPQAGTEHVTAAFAGASVALVTTTDGRQHRIGVLVGADLVNALAESPLSGLDLASATQPAIDAAAGALGARPAPAATVDLALVVADMAGPFTAVPLVGAGIDAAVLLSDTLLSAGAAEVVVAAPAAFAAPATATAPAAAPGPSLGVTAGQPPTQPVQPVQQGETVRPVPSGRGIEMLAGVEMEVTVELGRTRLSVRDLLALTPGTVLELDRAADGPADLLVNGRLIARGEVVVVDEDFGLRITEIVDDSGV